jgi:hypothetical protein
MMPQIPEMAARPWAIMERLSETKGGLNAALLESPAGKPRRNPTFVTLKLRYRGCVVSESTYARAVA